MRRLFLSLCLLGVPTLSHAQQTTYDVQNMNFSLWCQEVQRYPASRCEERSAEDVKTFEEYRAEIERYELDYLKKKESDARLQEKINRDNNPNARSNDDLFKSN
jgi:hypothetical protein